MEFIEVDYNRELKPLERVLKGVKHPGDFYVAGTVETPMPRVEVEGVGVLAFPIPAAQIEALVGRAERAPYGKGQETIVDTAVRNVWQIGPGRVTIGGRSWAVNFAAILARVARGLGCGEASFSVELYKLLVYEKGGFFLAHRDTEKTAGMFGTLVLTLPSAHSGGALRIRHMDREVTVETGEAEPSEIAFTAFYADCEHEALPVREGNRVCLVYNLIQQRAGKRKLRAPNPGELAEESAEVLRKFWKAPAAPPKIVWLLDHQYSPAGLSWAALKGPDAARASVLAEAARLADCRAYLGVVHIGESGAVDEESMYDRPRRRRGYWDDEEENVEEDLTEDGAGWAAKARFQPLSVDDSWRYVDEWRDAEDRAASFGRIPVSGEELLPVGALDGAAPDRQRLMEASGNEGVTYERSYHRAAVVVWPESRTTDALLAGGPPAALPYLKELAAGGAKGRAAALAAAERVVDAWPTERPHTCAYEFAVQWPGVEDRADMIAILGELKAGELLERFVRGAVAGGYEGGENAALVEACAVMGEAAADRALAALIVAKMAAKPMECVELLAGAAAGGELRLRLAGQAAVSGLDGIAAPKTEPDLFTGWTFAFLRRPPKEPERKLGAEFLLKLFAGVGRVDDGVLCEAAAGKMVARPEVFDVVEMVVPAITGMGGGKRRGAPAVERALRQLWSGAAEWLLSRSEQPPVPPVDWRLEVKIRCDCEDCRQLEAFALSPVEQVRRFRVKKERREHLHIAIEGYRLDMTHVTERKGSPQTLVCRKDRRSFEARQREYAREVAAMGELVKLGGAAAVCRRMEAAIRAGEPESNGHG